MRKTLNECKELRTKFIEWCDSQEPTYFVDLAALHIKMDHTIANYDKVPDSELDAMFRVINKVMEADA